jgi:uncharacterized protein YjbI with pentapeptide repeats
MANEEHLALLAEGVEAWNNWRNASPKVAPDLSGADLSGTDLRGANMGEARLSLANLGLSDLSGANLQGADLSGAEFLMANLAGANLSVAFANRADFGRAALRGADLTYANLCEADLTGSDLGLATLDQADLSLAVLDRAYAGGATFRGADLCEANLVRTDMSRADLAEANLTRSILGLTVFGDNDLSPVTGLEAVQHLGPLVLGTATIARCQGNVPTGFLAAAGVAATVASRDGGLVEGRYVFISHCDSDEALAGQVYADLQKRGLSCWLSPERLKGGGRFQSVFRELPASRVRLLVIVSENALEAAWLEDEARMAFTFESDAECIPVLLPVCVDDAATESGWVDDLRMARPVCDVRGWEENDERFREAMESLAGDLRA